MLLFRAAELKPQIPSSKPQDTSSKFQVANFKSFWLLGLGALGLGLGTFSRFKPCLQFYRKLTQLDTS